LPLESDPPWPLLAPVPRVLPSTAVDDVPEAPIELVEPVVALLPVEPVEPVEPIELLELLGALVPYDEPWAAPLLPLVSEPPWPLAAPVPLVLPSTAVELLAAPVVLLPVVALCDVVVSVLGDFLLLFMSPSASAEPLARATIEVRMNAGASLRMRGLLGWYR
jgi:hypothetical protein